MNITLVLKNQESVRADLFITSFNQKYNVRIPRQKYETIIFETVSIVGLNTSQSILTITNRTWTF